VDTPVGRVPALKPPGVVDAFEYRVDRIAALGEHTDAILRELGYTEAQISQLRASGAV